MCFGCVGMWALLDRWGLAVGGHEGWAESASPGEGQHDVGGEGEVCLRCPQGSHWELGPEWELKGAGMPAVVTREELGDQVAADRVGRSEQISRGWPLLLSWEHLLPATSAGKQQAPPEMFLQDWVWGLRQNFISVHQDMNH